MFQVIGLGKVGSEKSKTVLYLLTEFAFTDSSEVKIIQLCPILCDSMDYTVHGILQARILEWVAVPFSRGPSQHRDQTQVSHITGRL